MLNCWDRDILQYIGRNSATTHRQDAFSGSLPHVSFPPFPNIKSGRVSNKTYYNFHAARRVEKSGVYIISKHINLKHEYVSLICVSIDPMTTTN